MFTELIETEEAVEIHCPKCGSILEHFSGLENIPEHLYCPICVDAMYDVATGEEIGRLV
jgi:Zn finger protein HypA/HybF involved in hydrogenase expression